MEVSRPPGTAADGRGRQEGQSLGNWGAIAITGVASAARWGREPSQEVGPYPRPLTSACM